MGRGNARVYMYQDKIQLRDKESHLLDQYAHVFIINFLIEIYIVEGC